MQDRSAAAPRPNAPDPIALGSWSTLFSVFGFAWAFQALEEKSDRLNPAALASLDGASDLLVIAAAIVLLCRPASLRAWLAFSSAALLNSFIELPHIMNHLVIAMGVNAVIFVRLARSWATTGLARDETADATRAAVLRDLSPFAQICVVLLYAFAFFHKLNWDFVDLTSTCVAFSYQQLQMILGVLPTLSDPLLIAGIVFTYAVEGALPLLLLVDRTRYAALAIGAGFHLVLGSYVPSFTILLFALYLFFLPPELLSRMVVRVRNLPGVGPHARQIATLVAAIVLCALYALYLLPQVPAIHLMRWLWLSVGIATAVGFALLSRSVAAPPPPFVPARTRSPLCIVLIALVCLNGLSPYLGFKTAVNFAMYSNLRTEGDSNHMLIPKGALQLVDLQDDLVEIVTSQNPHFLAYRGLSLPRFELRRRLQLEPEPVALTIRRRGETITSDDMRSHPVFGAPIPWPLGKLMIFRPVPAVGSAACFW